MTVLQNPIYDSHQPYIPNTSMTTDQDVQQQSLPGDEQYITTFFCRALYDYQTQDSSSLAFQRNDIIEVLTRLESGWWDGLLGDERGWFPSNYVTMISDEEAEMALSASEYSMQQVSEIDPITDGSDGTATALQSGLNGDWLDGDMGHLNSHTGLVELANATLEESATLSDFWMPQVTPEGIVRVRHFPGQPSPLCLHSNLYYRYTM
jgi:son of sevenless-like protein